MFGWPKKKTALDSSIAANQQPGAIFPWPKGAIITAVDEIILAIPAALVEKDKPMQEFIFGADNMEISIAPNSNVFLARLRPGMSLSLAKSVEAYIVAEDNAPRRIRVTMPPRQNDHF